MTDKVSRSNWNGQQMTLSSTSDDLIVSRTKTSIQRPAMFVSNLSPKKRSAITATTRNNHWSAYPKPSPPSSPAPLPDRHTHILQAQRPWSLSLTLHALRPARLIENYRLILLKPLKDCEQPVLITISWQNGLRVVIEPYLAQHASGSFPHKTAISVHVMHSKPKHKSVRTDSTRRNSELRQSPARAVANLTVTLPTALPFKSKHHLEITTSPTAPPLCNYVSGEGVWTWGVWWSRHSRLSRSIWERVNVSRKFLFWSGQTFFDWDREKPPETISNWPPPPSPTLTHWMRGGNWWIHTTTHTPLSPPHLDFHRVSFVYLLKISHTCRFWPQPSCSGGGWGISSTQSPVLPMISHSLSLSLSLTTRISMPCVITY
jgi:hypothetical protein